MSSPCNPYTATSSPPPPAPLHAESPRIVAPHAASRKRPRGHVLGSVFTPLFEPFSLHPFLADIETHAQLATPLSIIDRAQLPFSLLDLAQNTCSSAVPRVFLSSNPVLGNHLATGDNHTSRLLVVHLAASDRLGAIEQLQSGIYTLSPLASWVSVEHVKYLRRDIRKRITCPRDNLADSQRQYQPWWSGAAVEASTPSLDTPALPEAGLNNNFETTEQFNSCDGAANTTVSDDTRQANPGEYIGHSSLPHLPTDDAPESQITHEELCTDLSRHYLEALYLSKTSLAYFAKGPLSRARANASNSAQLCEFLRTMVLSSTVLDKKYKTKVPEIVKTLAAENLTHASQQNNSTVKKQRKRKRIGPRKDGLYDTEIDVLETWWSGQEVPPGVSIEAMIKIQVAHLRFREHLLQLVLMFEVMAIEKTSAGEPEGLATSKPHDLHDANAIKKRNPQDIEKSLEVLIDRLCIWQSIEGLGPSNTAEHARGGGTDGALRQDSTLAKTNDRLKEFCLDVLIPFYAARLTDKVNEAAQRVGVTMNPSPKQHRLYKSGRPAIRAAPGEKVERAPRRKMRDPLSRVASDHMNRGPARPPTLSRSATDPAPPAIKREKSATPQLSSFEPTPRRSLSRSSSISMSKKYSQREVDMSAIARFNEAKSKRKITVEQELQDAIATLKKPNRTLAVKEYVEAVESTGRTRPSARPSKHASMAIEVGATPKKGSRNVIRGSSENSSNLPATEWPSTDPCVPSSAVRISANTARSTQANARTANSLLETPSRGSNRTTDPLQVKNRPVSQPDPDVVPQSISKGRPGKPVAAVSDSPARPTPVPAAATLPAASPAQKTVFATPVKPRKMINQATESALATPPQATATPVKRSIYETLGWDDDEVDELM